MEAMVFKCNACETGPCFLQCDKAMIEDPIGYGEDSILTPVKCPHNMSNPEWELLAINEALKCIQFANLAEWLGGEGWEKAPPEIREGILALGLVHSYGISIDKARQAFGIFCDYDNYYLSYLEFQKEVQKFSKMEIIAGLLPEAFRAGIIWREKYLQENRK